MLLEQGLDAVFARHQRWGEGVRTAVRGWGLPIQCADAAVYSPVLTGVVTPPGVDADAVRQLIHSRFDLSLGTGLGKVKGRMEKSAKFLPELSFFACPKSIAAFSPCGRPKTFSCLPGEPTN